MAGRIVDLLEVVQIDEKERSALFVPFGPLERFVQPFEKKRPVGKFRQRIVCGGESKLLSRCLQLRNIRQHRHPIGRFAVFVEDGIDGQPREKFRSVVSDDGHFAVEIVFRIDGAIDMFHRCPIEKTAEIFQSETGKPILFDPEHPAESIVDLQIVSVSRGDQNAFRRILEYLFDDVEIFDRFLFRRHIPHDGDRRALSILLDVGGHDTRLEKAPLCFHRHRIVDDFELVGFDRLFRGIVEDSGILFWKDLIHLFSDDPITGNVEELIPSLGEDIQVSAIFVHIEDKIGNHFDQGGDSMLVALFGGFEQLFHLF